MNRAYRNLWHIPRFSFSETCSTLPQKLSKISDENPWPGLQPIRAIERGISVMRALDELGTASLHQLHEKTGLHRTTLLRILLTLEQQELIRRGVRDGLNAISDPVRADDQVLGCVNLVWMRQAVPLANFVASHLSDLQAATAEIAAAYRAAGQSTAGASSAKNSRPPGGSSASSGGAMPATSRIIFFSTASAKLIVSSTVTTKAPVPPMICSRNSCSSETARNGRVLPGRLIASPLMVMPAATALARATGSGMPPILPASAEMSMIRRRPRYGFWSISSWE